MTLALVNYTYRDPTRDGVLVEVGQVGKYAPGQVVSASGQVIVGNLAGKLEKMAGKREKMAGNLSGGKKCEFLWSSAPVVGRGAWVALIKRGGSCSDEEKIEIAANNNATAVILYTGDEHAHLRKLNVKSKFVLRFFLVLWCFFLFYGVFSGFMVFFFLVL